MAQYLFVNKGGEKKIDVPKSLVLNIYYSKKFCITLLPHFKVTFLSKYTKATF